MKIFFSSPGRRVELIKLFKKEYKELIVLGGDYSNNSPALMLCDKTFTLPYKIDEKYIEKVLKICIDEKVDLVIPLIDHELELYSKYKKIFNENGIEIMISDETSIRISNDKIKTFNFFNDYDFVNTPFTCLLKDFNENKNNFKSDFVIIKPRIGSSGINLHKINKSYVNEYAKLLELDRNLFLVQEFIDFDFEVTTDVFIDKNNRLVELCQRKRLKVRCGEVERAITIKDKKISKIIENIIKRTSFFGVINIQIMVKDDKYFIGEINPRFGGGFPLSYYAGANMIEHLLNHINNKKIKQYCDSRYLEGLYMLRFDNAIYRKDIDDD